MTRLFFCVLKMKIMRISFRRKYKKLTPSISNLICSNKSAQSSNSTLIFLIKSLLLWSEKKLLLIFFFFDVLLWIFTVINRAQLANLAGDLSCENAEFLLKIFQYPHGWFVVEIWKKQSFYCIFFWRDTPVLLFSVKWQLSVRVSVTFRALKL